jgi:hypothetical protein
MVGYIASIRQNNINNIKKLNEKICKIFRTDFEETEEQKELDAIGLQFDLEYQIIEIIEKEAEEKEFISVESHEDSMIVDFHIYFEEVEPNISYKLNEPLSPEETKNMYVKISKLINENEGKEKAINSTIDQHETFDREHIGIVFDKWLRILRHAAKNNNCYCFFVTSA